jgi:Ni/Co efflux regulator RcnB
MKKLILGALATVMAVPMAAAPADAQVHRQTTVRHTPNGTVTTTRTWRTGQRFDRRYAQNYQVVDYRRYRNRRLSAPPRGYYWARSGRDAVLVRQSNGVIRTVITRVF